MHPVIDQAFAAEKVRELHAHAAARQRAVLARRGARTLRERRAVPRLRAMRSLRGVPGRGSASLTSAAGQP
jgi:hypothetical protein